MPWKPYPWWSLHKGDQCIGWIHESIYPLILVILYSNIGHPLMLMKSFLFLHSSFKIGILSVMGRSTPSFLNCLPNSFHGFGLTFRTYAKGNVQWIGADMRAVMSSFGEVFNFCDGIFLTSNLASYSP